MGFRKIQTIFIVAALASLIALAGCTQSSSQSSSSASASGNTQIAAADTTASSASAAAQASVSASAQSASATAASAAAPSSDKAAESSDSAFAPGETEVDAVPDDPSQDPDNEGPEPINPDELLVTGTVVCTTFQERAEEVNFGGSDFDSDDMLTLLVLDDPIEVTAYKGGGDYTGSVSVIRLPDDEMFRQFKDQSITIGIDSWGAFPADLSAALYDLVLTFDDGLELAAY